jgi:Bacterial type II secretion system protein G.
MKKKTVYVWAASLILSGLVVVGILFFSGVPRVFHAAAASAARVAQWKKRMNEHEEEKVSSSRMNAHGLARTLFEYHKKFETYPENGRIEEALRGDNPGRIEWLRPGAFLDPWERRYELTITENGYLHVRSPGPDGVKGNKDDLFYESCISGGR